MTCGNFIHTLWNEGGLKANMKNVLRENCTQQRGKIQRRNVQGDRETRGG